MPSQGGTTAQQRAVRAEPAWGCRQLEKSNTRGSGCLRRLRGSPGGGGSLGAPLPLLLGRLPVRRLPRQDRVLGDPAIGAMLRQDVIHQSFATSCALYHRFESKH